MPSDSIGLNSPVTFRCAEARDNVDYAEYHAMLVEASGSPCYCSSCDDARLVTLSASLAWA